MRGMTYLVVSLTLFCALFFPSGLQASVESQGKIAIESRVFKPDSDPSTHDQGLSFLSQIELFGNQSIWEEKLRLSHRTAMEDASRQLTNIEEAWVGYRGDRFNATIGYQLLNWTALEAFHPVDVINSRNLDSPFENAEKFGEPMVSLGYMYDQGSIYVYGIPFFQAPKFPGVSNRLNFSSGTAIGSALWMHDDGRLDTSSSQLQGALRWDHSFSDADLSLHALHHFDRSQPVIVFDTTTQTARPVHLRVTQLGGTLQYILQDWIVKVEAANRHFHSPKSSTSLGTVKQLNHFQLALGLEYGWESDQGYDNTILIEGQNYFGTTKTERAGLGAFQRDILLGYRLAFNDVNSREIFLGFIYDLDQRDEWMWSSQYQQRLSDVWKLSTGLRLIGAPSATGQAQGLQGLAKSDQVFLTLERYF